MLHKMAINIAYFFSANSDTFFDEDDVEVYAYGTELLIASVFETLTVLILGIVFGKVLETIAFLVAFITLRGYAGGYHAKTHLKCFCVALINYAVFLLVQFTVPIQTIHSILLMLTFVSGLPILFLAPVGNPNRPVGPIQQRKFRNLSLIMYLIQAATIIGWNITKLTPYIAFGFVIGQLSASGSLVAVKVRDYCKGGAIDACKNNS